MKIRNWLGAGAVMAIAALPLSPAGAIPVTDGYANGSDPAGDTTSSENDILDFTMRWSLSEFNIEIGTDSALPAITDPSWAKPSTSHAGRSLVVDFRVNDSADYDYPSINVDADGAAMWWNDVTVTGESGDVTSSKLCDVVFDPSGSPTLSIPVGCIGNPGKIDATATLGDPADEASVDYAIAGPSDEDATPISDTVSGGYWMTAEDGGVFAIGTAEYYGSMGGKSLNRPMVGIAASQTGDGYWTVASDGGIFAYGDATFAGSMGGKALNKPMVGVAGQKGGTGYWTVASDGGVFAYGGAGFFGSMGGKPLNSPIVGIEGTDSGNGYWLFAEDGGVFAYGDATFHGSMGGKPLLGKITGGAANGDGTGYRLIATDGGVFAFGDAAFKGAPTGTDALDAPVKAIVTMRDGYTIVDHRGDAITYGDAFHYGGLDTRGVTPAKPIVGVAAKNVVAPI